QVEIILFDILTVIAFCSGQAKQPFLQDRITFVPQRHAQTQVLKTVAHTAQPVLVPTVCPAARVAVWKVIPGIAIRAVILTNRTPGAITDIRPPVFPILDSLFGLG